ncbi:hypothetical protein G6F66_014703 [Rhizopus arrhizus]|nr:hypothetical protein G6F66_014703 [Rhizopus arrhizus]
MDTQNLNAAASSSAAANGAKETVSSPSLGTAASSWATVASRGTKTKLRRRAAAARSFQPVSGNQGFEYVYIPRSRTVGQKTDARNPFFSIFVAYILPQWYKLPLFLHSRFPTCIEKSERV